MIDPESLTDLAARIEEAQVDVESLVARCDVLAEGAADVESRRPIEHARERLAAALRSLREAMFPLCHDLRELLASRLRQNKEGVPRCNCDPK